MGAAKRTLTRPLPANEGDVCGFLPAPEIVEWIRLTFLNKESELFNIEHDHLNSALIGALWTDVPNQKHGRMIAAQAEMPFPQGGPWQKARQIFQINQWFGFEPDFILTFDSRFAFQLDDTSWCALVEHELYHCGQALDIFGIPKFRKKTGEPIFAIKGHDIEEFAGVIRRYGITEASAGLIDILEAARRRPEISSAQISANCGVCLQ